uniref:Cytochrome b5 heme-binding domain-containing protein n=1 Tax=Cannabis sativa TaxID=3483 RepID=A0A803QQ18_CANSA
MPSLTKLFSMEEISQHNTKDDCWVVIDDKVPTISFMASQTKWAFVMVFCLYSYYHEWVYDLSSYLDEHPGGDDVVLAATGKDATEDFEDAGHSKTAKELMQSFFIGELDTSDFPEPDIVSKKPTRRDYAQKLIDLAKQYWVVPTAVVGLSVVVGFLIFRKK